MEPNNPYAAPQTTPTPEHEHTPGAPLDLADRGSRFAAALIDGLILFSIVFVAGAIVGIFIATSTGSAERVLEFTENPLFAIGCSLIGMIIFIGINFHFWATRGQSIGKMVLKIKIVRTDGSKATVGRLVGHRYLAISALGLIPVVGVFISFLDPLFIFRQDHNCLHDDIADTRVIRVPQPHLQQHSPPPPQPPAI